MLRKPNEPRPPNVSSNFGHMNTQEDFKKYIKETFDGTTETASYRERIGEPDELPAVLGLISMNFSSLEDMLGETIIKMLQLDNDRGLIVTSELSFKAKVNLFASLYYNLKDQYFFNTFPGFENEYFKELVKALNRIEEQRNQVIHSAFIQKYNNKLKIYRHKTTAKQKHGLKISVEETDIIKLFNIADNITCLEFELDQFQIGIMDKKTATNSK